MLGLDWLRKGKSISPDDAAALLYKEARVDIAAECFPGLPPRIHQGLDAVLYFTKVAIIIHSLRILEDRSRSAEKWNLLLRSFEGRVFTRDVLRELDAISYVNKLISLTVRLNGLLDNNTMPEQQHQREMRLWWEEWLEPILPEVEELEAFLFVTGPVVIVVVGDQMIGLTKMISHIGRYLTA